MRWSGAVIPKIDNLAVNGLLGVNNSLAYRVHELEAHFHCYERWFGLAASPNGEVHAGDGLTTTVAPFVIDAGNDTWGTWTIILGSSDTPMIAGTTKWDVHAVQITTNERANSYYFQFAYGNVAADAFTAGDYSSKVFSFDGTNLETRFDVRGKRQAAGTKLWARCKVVGQNTGTLGFYLGMHEYVG